MALPKNKSRKIVVANVEYRYAISKSEGANGKFDLNITIQCEECNGRKLLLYGLVTRDLWLDFSDISGRKIDKNAYPVITPKHIEYFITKAAEKGWNPFSNGNDFTLRINNEDITNHSSGPRPLRGRVR